MSLESLADGNGLISLSRYRLELICEGEIPYGECHASRPSQTVPLVRDLVARLDREVLGVLFIDTRHRIIGYTIAYVGTMTRTICEPRGILVPALLANAAGVVLFHNHPSGDPSPSQEDLLMTRRLREAGDIVGITVVDHLIVGSHGQYVSLRERGELC